MTFESLPTTIRNNLLGICDAFEESWRAGRGPRIESCLGGRPDPERTVLLRMLREIEDELRQTAGDYSKSTERIGDAPGPTDATSKSSDSGGQTDLRTTLPDPHIPITGPASRPPPERIGRYRVIRHLGRGNFEVYLARDDDHDRDVAIKISRHDRPAARRLMPLAQEAEKLKSLDHPRIVKLYEYNPGDAAGGDAFLVLEYIEGRTLEELILEGSTPVDRLVQIVASVAETVGYAHSLRASVTHRDLKPSNILLDLDGEPHVCDFGLAVDEEIQRLRQGEVSGTLRYMAPEQVRGEANHIDGRTDIWALGVILYRGLTGKYPFTGQGQDEIFKEILERDPKPIRMSNPSVSAELERICLRCLSRPMAERYLTADDLASDLRRAIRELPAHAATPDPIVPKGLAPFDVEDARFFLAMLPGPRRGDGMPESVRFWKDRIEASEGDRAFSVGLLYGPSGGGKSSFVRAGLLPNLDRGRVRPIYLEARPNGTEARLLADLRLRCPHLPPEAGLPEAIATLRDDVGRGASPKVLIVLDQFEQWLQAHSDEPNAELVRALRQCDGRRVQALVLVRDDFWMAVTRFFRAVDVPIRLADNAAAVELFDERHARMVLEGFGKALGQVPDDARPGPSDFDQFVEEAVRGLRGADDRVIPVRMTLLTEVVRDRPWTPATLRELGGADGIGIKFLDDRFASAPYKQHGAAAKKVLEKLLPAPTSAIRGEPCTAADLRAAAEYADRPEAFAELIRILDGDLKLIAAADHEDAKAGPAPAEAAYQLSHDYLVRPIRQWLEREEGSTRKGRAVIRLRLITASWLSRRGPRQLPSTLELATILRHIPSSEWSADQRRLIRAAQRHLLTRAAAAVILVAALAWGIKSDRDQAAADSLLRMALGADFRTLADKMPEFGRYKDILAPKLEAYEPDGTPPAVRGGGGAQDEPHRVHAREIAAILLYRFTPTPDRGSYLRSLLRTAPDPEKSASIRDALAEHPATAGVESVRRLLLDRSAEPGARLRAACVLAKIDPDGAWAGPDDLAALQAALTAEDRRTIPRWIDLLGPTARALIPAMTKDCRDPDVAPFARIQVAEAMAEILTHNQDPEGMARQIVAAQPDASRILRGSLARVERHEESLRYLRGVIDERPEPDATEDRKDEVASRRAEAAVTLAVLGEPGPLWPLLDHQPDPRLRARLIETLADSGLPPQVLLDRLRKPGVAPAQKQAILMALAEAARAGTADIARAKAKVVEAGVASFRLDSDPGVHSAAELLLHRLDLEGLARVGDPPPPDIDPVVAQGQRWFDGPNGHTFAILHGPLESVMGPLDGEDPFDNYYRRHHRRIDRSIAVATKEVSADQFRQFRGDYRPIGRGAQVPGVVANAVSWYEAANYCNWLSQKAKIPPAEWCYPADVKSGAKIEAAALEKTGYRLPTEAEWEYFCRAGTETSRSFGRSDALLSRYAWTWLNSNDRSSPPGRLLPNQFGLFDTLGNVEEWCQDGPTDKDKNYQDPYPEGTRDRPAPDVIRDRADLKNDDALSWFYLRGASYEQSPYFARSAFRDEGPVNGTHRRWGFRVVRTLRKDRN